MKKFFLFAAAVAAAMTINAQVTDLAAVGTTIDEWTLGAQASLNSSESDEAKGKYVYDITGGADANVTYITANPSIEFQTKNSSAKTKAFAIYPGKCFEFGGKNGVLVLKGTTPGMRIRLTVAAKGSTAANFADAAGTFPKNAVAVTTDLVLPAKDKNAEGADDQGYVWKELEYQSLGGDVEIKEFAGGYRITKIILGAGEGVENTKVGEKAVKIFENGQLVIIKNGVRYNAIGVQL